ncbi:MAG: polysaccharide biosynthesis tyrosine autokinase [Endomicrobia bacterium]|nr:polysaccharide biosynthesis tyrosine autokinase [Endomicrobiia bacterium]MCX7940622.1 polysaccharide biosynthesis tyrosine autokinase [Endomicrobiia bacterium]MDW8055308.1 polysaccharide biosynthesis tyrosine autokinase [Elusimicrobiota bacterium]
MPTIKYELNLYDYWRIIKRRKFVIFSSVVSVILFTWIYTNLQTPIYQATAVVKIEPSLIIPGVATEMLGWDMLNAVNTEVKIINSAVIAERTAEKIGLVSEFTDEITKQNIVSSIQGKIRAERIADSNLVRIIATSSNKEETAKLANATAEVYIEKGIEDRTKRARELREFIEKQLVDAEKALKESEEKLREFTEKTKTTGVGGQLAVELLSLQTKKAELLKTYTEKHPDVISLNQKIKFIEEQLTKLPKEELEYARLTREVKLNEELYTLLAKRYKEAQISEADRVQTAFIVTPATVPSRPIRPNYISNLTLGTFIGVILGLIFAFIVEHLDTSIATIEEVETFLELRVIGVIPHIEEKIQKRKFVLIPVVKSNIEDIKNKLVIYHSVKSPYVESYHTLRTNIKFTQEHVETRGIVLFTSSGIAEGKTLTSVNFALAAAIAGVKTLFVELDLRRPSVHRWFGINRVPGFVDYVSGRKSLDEVLHTTTDFLLGGLDVERIVATPGLENFTFLSCGNIPPNPVDVLSSSNTVEALFELKEKYELVVLDTPPVLLFADALILSKYATYVVLVYRVGRIARGALKRAKDMLSSIKANVVGVVLNDIRAEEMEPRYGYYYAYKYYSKEK